MRRKVILDVDTGTDDAIAIMLAALHSTIDLVSCTVVNGNAAVEYCTDNTLRVLDLIGRSDVPVYEGCARPLCRPDFPVPRDPTMPKALHGLTLPLPAAISRKRPSGAVQFLVETFRESQEELTLVSVGPLTNIAAAVVGDRNFAARVPELVIMGGGREIGNVTVSAEFNFWADPEAASVVLSAGFPRITLVTLDATHRALITNDDCDVLESLGTAAGRASATLIRHRIEVHDRVEPMAIPHSAPVHDALCVGFLIDGTLLATRTAHVAVETQGALTVGRSIIDTEGRTPARCNCQVALDADGRRFFALLRNTFA